MPLLYVDVIEGRTPEELRALLDGMHDAVVEDWSFGHGRARLLTGELT
jgi:hypothetical protein